MAQRPPGPSCARRCGARRAAPLISPRPVRGRQAAPGGAIAASRRPRRSRRRSMTSGGTSRSTFSPAVTLSSPSAQAACCTSPAGTAHRRPSISPAPRSSANTVGIGRDQPRQPGPEQRPLRSTSLEEAWREHHVEHRVGRRRRRADCRRTWCRACRPTRCLATVLAREDRAHREAAGDALGGGHHVRLDARPFDRRTACRCGPCRSAPRRGRARCRTRRRRRAGRAGIAVTRAGCRPRPASARR